MGIGLVVLGLVAAAGVVLVTLGFPMLTAAPAGAPAPSRAALATLDTLSPLPSDLGPSTIAAPSAAPSPTSAPTPRSASPTQPARAPAPRPPDQAVVDFYVAVAHHDWPRAIALWSPAMQARYPPQTWLIDRFRTTTRIEISRLRTVAMDGAAGTARVALTLTEYRSVEPSPRTFVGSWDLVRLNGRWLLDAPHF